MANEDLNIRILQTDTIDAECSFRFVDRIRILFGRKFFVTTVVHLPRRCKIQTQTKYSVEKIFSRRKPVPPMGLAEHEAV